MKVTLDIPGIRIIDDVYDVDACASIIAEAERHGFAAAPITTASGFVHRPDMRNNRRAMWDDPERAAALWSTIAMLAPTEANQLPSGLNERLRVYRYGVGERFNWHYDGYYERPDGRERSIYTVMLYLNGDVDGGNTLVETGLPLSAWVQNPPPGVAIADGNDAELVVSPRLGRLLCFRHRLHHCGDFVRGGHKDVLRTDLMFAVLE